MHTMKHTLLHSGRTAAILFSVAVFAAGAGSALQAQQLAPVSAAAPQLNLQAMLKAPVNPFDIEASSSSSNSTADTTHALATERLSLSSDTMQPPPRRRYGRPRYTDNQHNADGSSKYTFVIGGGVTLPVGGTKSYDKLSYSFQGGVGRNFNQNVGVIAQFDYDNFGIQTNTLNSLLAIYNSIGATDQNGNSLSSLGGSSHIWSLTLNPIYNFKGSEKTGAYVVGGAGFYHKTANFTIPATGTYCDYYYGCYQYAANQSIDKYTSNALGVNAGIGFTYKPSRFANQKFFAEARYVYTANQRRPYFDGTIGTATSSTYFNVFPQNSAPTTYIPVKFGIRF